MLPGRCNVAVKHVKKKKKNERKRSTGQSERVGKSRQRAARADAPKNKLVSSLFVRGRDRPVILSGLLL